MSKSEQVPPEKRCFKSDEEPLMSGTESLLEYKSPDLNSEGLSEALLPLHDDSTDQLLERILSKEEVQLEKQRLDLEREKIKLKQQQILWSLELKQKAIEIERKRQELREVVEISKFQREVQVKDRENQHRVENFNQYFKCFISVILVGAGIAFTLRGDNLGPYIMGTGATGAGIEAVSLIKGNKNKESDEEESDQKGQSDSEGV